MSCLCVCLIFSINNGIVFVYLTDGSALFRAFLAREYSEENIEFWIACEDYRKARSSKLPHKARKIFDSFVAVRSPKEVMSL